MRHDFPCAFRLRAQDIQRLETLAFLWGCTKVEVLRRLLEAADKAEREKMTLNEASNERADE